MVAKALDINASNYPVVDRNKYARNGFYSFINTMKQNILICFLTINKK